MIKKHLCGGTLTMLDNSVFKKLAHNDTGQARGHQAGIVIPKALSQFFPPLLSVTRMGDPTVDSILTADLFVDGQKVGRVETRYQHQTWGGTRSPERRLTDNLGVLRNQARENDILLFTKDIDDDSYIQLHLIRQGTSEYNVVNAKIGSSRWGPLDPENPPVTVRQIVEAEQDISRESTEPTNAFKADRTVVENINSRKARDRAFRGKVLEQYDYRCAFSGRKFQSPVGNQILGVDAAHVIPVAEGGSDHPANGMPLTKDLHWAFDKGLIGVDRLRSVIVPYSVRSLPGNEFLRDLHGTLIREAHQKNLRVMDEALEWHRRNRLLDSLLINHLHPCAQRTTFTSRPTRPPSAARPAPASAALPPPASSTDNPRRRPLRPSNPPPSARRRPRTRHTQATSHRPQITDA